MSITFLMMTNIQNLYVKHMYYIILSNNSQCKHILCWWSCTNALSRLIYFYYLIFTDMYLNRNSYINQIQKLIKNNKCMFEFVVKTNQSRFLLMNSLGSTCKVWPHHAGTATQQNILNMWHMQMETEHKMLWFQK